MSDEKKDLAYIKRVQAKANDDPDEVVDTVAIALSTHDGRRFALMSDKNKNIFRERAKVCIKALDTYFSRIGEEE